MDDKVLQHIENALNEVRTLFMKASLRIETIKPGEKIPATQLAEELAKEKGMTGPQLYPQLRILFEGYPGILVRKGAHGGLFRPAIGTNIVGESIVDKLTVDGDIDGHPQSGNKTTSAT